MDIVIDIETLGTKPGCPIIEIGACAIDASAGGAITANFSRRIASGFCYGDVCAVAQGSTGFERLIDRDTATWWTADPVRAATLRAIMQTCVFRPSAVDDALFAFGEWFSVHAPDPQRDRIWANGPSFDIAILDRAYADCCIKRPWICWQERCVRTALEQAGYERGSVPWDEGGPRHRAVNDARHEAKKLWRSGALGEISAIARRLRERKPSPALTN